MGCPNHYATFCEMQPYVHTSAPTGGAEGCIDYNTHRKLQDLLLPFICSIPPVSIDHSSGGVGGSEIRNKSCAGSIILPIFSSCPPICSPMLPISQCCCYCFFRFRPAIDWSTVTSLSHFVVAFSSSYPLQDTIFRSYQISFPLAFRICNGLRQSVAICASKS